jgi:hypothetical protein
LPSNKIESTSYRKINREISVDLDIHGKKCQKCSRKKERSYLPERTYGKDNFKNDKTFI